MLSFSWFQIKILNKITNWCVDCQKLWLNWLNYAQNNVYNPDIKYSHVNRKLVWNNVPKSIFKGMNKLSNILINNSYHSIESFLTKKAFKSWQFIFCNINELFLPIVFTILYSF